MATGMALQGMDNAPTFFLKDLKTKVEKSTVDPKKKHDVKDWT